MFENVFACMICAKSIEKGQRRRILVVRVTSRSGAKKWTLPGGKIDPGEKPLGAAMRELREEAGNSHSLHDAVQYISHSGNTIFFVTTYDFESVGHDDRVAIFQSRGAFHRNGEEVETDDYGFARLEWVEHKRGYRWVIRDYKGIEKDVQTIRDGTIEGLTFACDHAF